MNSKMYKINEVAQLHNMSKKTLIYYDKIGLFKPNYVDEKNNYRYYCIKEFAILKHIIYLKKIGFSLDEIKFLLGNRTHNIVIQALTHRRTVIIKEITRLQEMTNSIEHYLNFYKAAKYIQSNDLYKPSIKIFPERKIFYLKCNNAGSKEEIMLTFRRVLKHLDEINMFSHREYGTIYFKKGIQDGFKNNVGSFISIAKSYDIKEETTIEEGKYICMYKDGGYYNEDAIKYLLTWINKNGYQVISDIYEYSLVDYTFTKSVENMISELQVMVR